MCGRVRKNYIILLSAGLESGTLYMNPLFAVEGITLLLDCQTTFKVVMLPIFKDQLMQRKILCLLTFSGLTSHLAAVM